MWLFLCVVSTLHSYPKPRKYIEWNNIKFELMLCNRKKKLDLESEDLYPQILCHFGYPVPEFHLLWGYKVGPLSPTKGKFSDITSLYMSALHCSCVAEV